MSDQPKGHKYHLLKCPLCEGRGELPQKEMLDRLKETDLGHKLASYVENFIVADEKAAEPESESVSRPARFQAPRGCVELHPLPVAPQSQRVRLLV